MVVVVAEIHHRPHTRCVFHLQQVGLELLEEVTLPAVPPLLWQQVASDQHEARTLPSHHINEVGPLGNQLVQVAGLILIPRRGQGF